MILSCPIWCPQTTSSSTVSWLHDERSRHSPTPVTGLGTCRVHRRGVVRSVAGRNALAHDDASRSRVARVGALARLREPQRGEGTVVLDEFGARPRRRAAWANAARARPSGSSKPNPSSRRLPTVEAPVLPVPQQASRDMARGRGARLCDRRRLTQPCPSPVLFSYPAIRRPRTMPAHTPTCRARSAEPRRVSRPWRPVRYRPRRP